MGENLYLLMTEQMVKTLMSRSFIPALKYVFAKTRLEVTK